MNLRGVVKRVAPYHACLMTHTKFEIEFELAARGVEARVRPDRAWVSWRRQPDRWVDWQRASDPGLALTALRVMFRQNREGLLVWQEREKLRLHALLEGERRRNEYEARRNAEFSSECARLRVRCGEQRPYFAPGEPR